MRSCSHDRCGSRFQDPPDTGCHLPSVPFLLESADTESGFTRLSKKPGLQWILFGVNMRLS